jgi:hypothetical protein
MQRQFNGEMTGFLTNGTTLNTKSELGHISHTKISSKWATDLKCKFNIIKLLDKSILKNLCDLELGRVLRYITKASSIKGKS